MKIQEATAHMTSSGNEAVKGVREGQVAKAAERQLSVSHWLLGAASDPATARTQWAEQGVALLACGGIFSAVRIPARLVWAAADSCQLGAVDAFLGRRLDGGAVLMDVHAHLYYFLVPRSVAGRREERDCRGVEVLGRNAYLGIPATRLTEPRGRSYWCVPMEAPGDLCYTDEVGELIRAGRASLAARDESVFGV